jgi:hypothetical protein
LPPERPPATAELLRALAEAQNALARVATLVGLETSIVPTRVPQPDPDLDPDDVEFAPEGGERRTPMTRDEALAAYKARFEPIDD